MKQDSVIGKIGTALCAGLGVTALGTAGFMAIEGYSWPDALYMTVITISTVGYGEVHPLSPAGRLFASLLILVGFCSLAFIGQTVVESVFERLWTNRMETRKMRKTIDRLASHFIICGYGRVGEAAAERFQALHQPFVIIEREQETCLQLKEKGYLFIHGDATDDQNLVRAGIKRARGLLALLNQDPFNMFIVLSARELNPTLHIISRADLPASSAKLLQAGADTAMSPLQTAGRRIADELLTATGRLGVEQEVVEKDLTPEWIEVKAGSSMEGKTIAEITAAMDHPVLGLRQREKDTLMPDGDVRVEAGDLLLVMESAAPEDDEDTARRAAPEQIVIIDDNPVIVRLYNRLFQKAGFHPVVAADGKEGLARIQELRPTAAVIDYRLPGLSGIEICRAVRRDPACRGCKLILFTADDQAATHDEALAAGADAVVVKSADAAGIINKVVEMLRAE